jgi:DNA-binding MarR family transcriptional regulator
MEHAMGTSADGGAAVRNNRGGERGDNAAGRVDSAAGGLDRAAGRADGGPERRADRHPTDEVDDLVAAWHAERPDLDVRPMQVLSRISRLARHLDRERRSAFAAHDLESWEFDVLAALRRQGPPYELSPGALLRATLVTSGTMTNRIDRLEQSGLVRRRPDPQDKRGVLVTLTAAGASRVDAALADLLEAEYALLAALPESSRHTLADLLRILLAPLDAG